MTQISKFAVCFPLMIFSCGAVLIPDPVVALPPPDDTPEEILRTQIIIEARSPIDSSPLSAAEYIELQRQLEEGILPPAISPTLKDLIFALKVRKLFKTVIPF
jgi:hypothetical protein